ncbi:hypothetical protein ACQP1W_17640 [Spirillospora sp. CA-255316]
MRLLHERATARPYVEAELWAGKLVLAVAADGRGGLLPISRLRSCAKRCNGYGRPGTCPGPTHREHGDKCPKLCLARVLACRDTPNNDHVTLRRVRLSDIRFLPDTRAHLEHHHRQVPESIEAAGYPISEQEPTPGDTGQGADRSCPTPGEPLDWFTTPATVMLAIAVEEGIVTASGAHPYHGAGRPDLRTGLRGNTQEP